MNWYAALVIIVLVGIGSVALARYHYAKTPKAVAPTVGQTWHAGLSFDVCGVVEPTLDATPSGSSTGLTTTGSGVLLIAPKTSSEAGKNATLGKFASGYAGMTLTNSSVQYPGAKVLYKNGQKCAAGTPDAGKAGVVQARSWTIPASAAQKGGSETTLVGGNTTSKAADLRLRNRQLITVGFGPATASLRKVPAATETALLQAIEGTTAPVTTTTTVPTTSTTAPATSSTSTTTTAPTTTTTKPSAATTTTTKPAG